MANIKEYIKKVMDGTVSLEEQQAALAQVEKTIVEAKQRRDESVGQKADMVVQALKTIEAKLEAKLAELNNTPAMQGVQGPTGKAGKDGVNGKDGLNGVSGKDGKDGVNGVDGKDGVSVVDAKIDFDGSLVVYLSDGNEIDCGQILSPDVAQNIIISSGGSGTSQVVTDTLVSLQTQINTLTGIDGTLGTMAQQDANAVAITGGTIDNTSIGVTTPSTVNATTITGQTARLNGTGQNLFVQSQTFENASWVKTNSTITANTSTAPDGTTTAETINEGTATGAHQIGQSTTISANTQYVFSCFAKNVDGTYFVLSVRGASSHIAAAEFNISTGTLSKTYAIGTGFSVDSTSITAVGNDWYRCVIAVTSGTTVNSQTNYIAMSDGSAFTASGTPSYTGTNRTILIWGAQFELASSVGNYIPTTTTAVYGTPTLSFSGVSSIGLLSNGALYLQPAGTGALQAQATTSTTAGGNARGANAVDWQTARSAASQVASAANSVIGGGTSNAVSGGGGSGVFTGNGNSAGGIVSFVGTGLSNAASGYGSVICGGYANSAAGFWNFIGTGYTNSGTSGSAVTTQSGTMNATTAVTLSGSNANIKVGQLITGTSIQSFPPTYVAAISGTSLTLSQNASGSSTSTLSFFTPHGVVVGGGNNQATGSYSFIGGGGDAGTAANRNVASGDWSFVGGGRVNQATGLRAIVGGGFSNQATAQDAIVSGGVANLASAISSSIIGGRNNTASGEYSTVLGNYYATTRGIAGAVAFGAGFPPIASASGVSQGCMFILGRQTTDATATVLATDGNAAGTTNQVILPNNSAYFFRGEVISGKTAAGDTKGWTIEGVIKRGANAASTALVGIPTVTSTYADLGAATWDIAVTADTTNGGIRVTFTGQAATTIRTVCQLRTTEMTY
jgi:hypothetical protein